MLQMRILSSLHRVFPQDCPEQEIIRLSAARNEPLSFQAAYRLEGGERSCAVNVRTESALPLSTYAVGFVPVLHTDTQSMENLPAPGLFPDKLLPKQTNPELVWEGAPWGKAFYEQGEETLLNAANDCWQSVWFTLNEKRKNLIPGVYPVKVSFQDGSGAVLAEKTLTVEIIAERLPKQKLMYTNWFHYDCLCDLYGEEPFTDRYFEIMADYVEKAARNGMNMLLMPAFTPPLDTPIGRERRTVQLVQVEKTSGGYEFDFSLMKRYLDLCRACGIEYFEHSHLFTQWGALAAPKVVATVNGKEKRIFGWETKATGKAYTAFLRAYLPALRHFLRGEGLEKKVLFHISDEPQESMAADYAAALGIVKELLKGCMLGDALSDYSFYEKGLVERPICVTSEIEPFLGHSKHLWAYYTGGQVFDHLSNRILVSSPESNRMLGVQLYYYKIEGFLHWGYNYYYDKLSHGLFDPNANPCGYNNHGGTCFFVYPSLRGEAIQSVRQKNFAEAIDDVRALQALEKKHGRAACEELIQKHFGELTFHTEPASPEALLSFREDVNRALAKA